MGCSVDNVAELEDTGPRGAVRVVRRGLGGEAFGIDWLELPPSARAEERDELGSR